mmetsp:Transcript_14572/g.37228  ORF Transcript_14572/g.37228 Transcript_14572/m.37228 type:complete len:255 (+) Transcript_14572:257-1021(+)
MPCRIFHIIVHHRPQNSPPPLLPQLATHKELALRSNLFHFHREAQRLAGARQRVRHHVDEQPLRLQPPVERCGDLIQCRRRAAPQLNSLISSYHDADGDRRHDKRRFGLGGWRRYRIFADTGRDMRIRCFCLFRTRLGGLPAVSRLVFGFDGVLVLRLVVLMRVTRGNSCTLRRLPVLGLFPIPRVDLRRVIRFGHCIRRAWDLNWNIFAVFIAMVLRFIGRVFPTLSHVSFIGNFRSTVPFSWQCLGLAVLFE